MPISRKIKDRLADWLRANTTITYRISIHYRIAPLVMPLVERLAADDEDGETLRCTLVPWHRAERPAIAVYRGDISTCRIDGPWQDVDGHWLPLGGLVLSPGITWHLTPFEAQALHDHMQKVIEDATCAWVNEHGPSLRRHVPAEINRKQADREAKAMIAAWALEKRQARVRSTYADEPSPVLCALCRKGLGHA
jgi:hypothetical protein